VATPNFSTQATPLRGGEPRVSPESICVSIQANGTGDYRAFDANGRSSREADIPSTGNGMDVSAVAEVLLSVLSRTIKSMRGSGDISRILDFDTTK
jgi:hypothetical protein